MSLEPTDPDTAVELYLEDRENDATRERRQPGNALLPQIQVGPLRAMVRAERHHKPERVERPAALRVPPLASSRRRDSTSFGEDTDGYTPVFIRWLEAIDGVKQDLSTEVQSPSLDAEDNVRDVMLDGERANEVPGYLETYEYASLNHVALSLCWHTTMRIGGARALDLEDYDRNEQYVEVHHRPESGTPIKNKSRGERLIALSGPMCSLLDDWIENQRPNTTDDDGRNPLLTTSHGRISKTSLRHRSSCYTRPCVYDNTCPHDRDLDECEALDSDHAPLCPSSVSLHALRRGSITRSLNEDVPTVVVSDRANVSSDVLEKHYDRRIEREKMEKRREFVEGI